MDIISSCGVVIYIITASIKMFILLITFSLVLLYIDKKSRDIYEKNYQNRRNIREQQGSTFNELIRGIRDIKVLNIRKNMTARIIKGQEQVNETSYKEHREQDLFHIIYGFSRNLITVITILYSLYLLSKNEIDGSLLLIIYMYHHRVMYLTSSFGHLYKGIKEINLNIKNIQDILNNPEYPKEKFGNISKEYFDGSIEFKNVSFKYDDSPILKDINIQIKQMAEIEGFQFKDPGLNLLLSNGKIDEGLFTDGLHPNEKGYQKLVDEILK